MNRSGRRMRGQRRTVSHVYPWSPYSLVPSGQVLSQVPVGKKIVVSPFGLGSQIPVRSTLPVINLGLLETVISQSATFLGLLAGEEPGDESGKRV